MFDRKAYMREYYKKNQNKLKSYSSDYKKTKRGVGVSPSPTIQVKKGPITLSFN